MKQLRKTPCGKSNTGLMNSLFILSLIIFKSNISVEGQNFIISPGTTTTGLYGTMVIKSDIVNNGVFNNIGDNIILAGSSQTLGGIVPVAFNDLTVSTGSTITVNTGIQTLSGTLLCDGTLNAGGKIALLSTEARTALVDGSGAGQVTGNLIMQRYLPSGFGYKYLSSPFQDATVGELGDDINLLASFPSLYRYDEGRIYSGWISYVSSSGLLAPLHGYSVNLGASTAPDTIDVGGVVNNGAMEITLYNHNNTYTKGFNLVGNPFPSPIDWDASTGWTKDNIDNAIYFFNASNTDQYGGTYSTYMGGISSDGIASNNIPSMQGFFVHVTDGTWPVAGTLGLDNSVRINNTTQTFLKSGKGGTPYIRIAAGYADDSLSYDPLCIYFDLNATKNFDGQYDAYKLFNTDKNVTNFYSFAADSSRLSINALPLNDSSFCKIRLGLKTERNGYVIFKIKDIIGEFKFKYVSVYDSFTGITQDITNGLQYKVSLIAGDYQKRFFLNFSNLKTVVPEMAADDKWFNIFSSYGTLKTEINLPSCEDGIFKIYNLAGQNLMVYKIHQPGYHEFTPALNSGIYVITFMSGNFRVSKKIFIQSQ